MSFSARVLLGAVGLAAFVLNPSFACSGVSDEDLASDMRTAAEGTWRVSIEDETGPTTFTVQLEQASQEPTVGSRAHRPRLVRAAMACDSQTFLKSAGACSDVYSMPLVGKVLEGDEATRAAVVTGRLRTNSKPLTVAGIEVLIGHRRLNGQLSAAGEVTSLVEAGQRRATMSRIAP
jgi:hypothetical protein